MSEWVGKMMDRIVCVIFALLLMQFPLFMEQYTLRLSGHVDELSYQLSKIERVAKASGKNLEQYIDKFVESGDNDFSKQGTFLREMAKRKDNLSSVLASIHNANPITRPFVFLFNSDWEIVQKSAASYHAGLSITFESAIYAAIGLTLGYYIYLLTSSFFGRVCDGLMRAQRKERGKKSLSAD